MLGEVLAAAIVGTAALWLILQPLIKPSGRLPSPAEPIDPEETPKGVALSALKEIEFDRETGKLSEQDYEDLKRRYTAAALQALRADPEPGGAEPVSDAIESMVGARLRALRFASGSMASDTPVRSPSTIPSCSSCGPRPEPDAVFCSTCGRRLSTDISCAGCGAQLTPNGMYCERCGRVVAA